MNDLTFNRVFGEYLKFYSIKKAIYQKLNTLQQSYLLNSLFPQKSKCNEQTVILMKYTQL